MELYRRVQGLVGLVLSNGIPLFDGVWRRMAKHFRHREAVFIVWTDRESPP